jgi:phage tail-like protein
MPDDNPTQTSNDQPLHKMTFSVMMGGIEGSFLEVTGLNNQAQAIENRGENSRSFSTVKMTEMNKKGNIGMKRGIFKGDKRIGDLYRQLTENTFKKTTISISLLDESRHKVMSWRLVNAFPVKIASIVLNANANEVTIESIELVHEGLEIDGA